LAQVVSLKKDEAMDQVRAEVNELVQIQLVDDPNSRTYYSRVEDASGDRLNISWPTEAGVRIPFHKSEQLFISFTRQDAVYGFQASVTATIPGPIPMLIVQSSGEIERIQRREYVRVPSLLPVELTAVVSSGSSESSPDVVSIKTNTVNVSGGGFAIHHRFVLPVGTMLQVKLTLPGHPEPLPLSARVVRNESREDVHKNRFFMIGVQFVTIPERIRMRIVRHVFDAQKAALTRED
jgi:c-di-GMP-binding flagellar brake protein YcgR